jgi:hypothetical protein
MRRSEQPSKRSKSPELTLQQLLYDNVPAHVFMLDYRGYGDRFNISSRLLVCLRIYAFVAKAVPAKARCSRSLK